MDSTFSGLDWFPFPNDGRIEAPKRRAHKSERIHQNHRQLHLTPKTDTYAGSVRTVTLPAQGRDFRSVRLDDPALPRALYAALSPSDDSASAMPDLHINTLAVKA